MTPSLFCGDCLDVMRGLPDHSIDAVVTDPPYGLSFMGNRWDCDVPAVEVWVECLRVLKPGGHLLAFAGTRTQHRMAVNVEDAGFEIRDMMAWVYATGFPKSLDVSKAIDRAAGAVRVDAVTGGHMGISERAGDGRNAQADAVHAMDFHGQVNKGASMRGTPVTEAAQQWAGWGTALKPAFEPITVARKPLAGSVANNVLTHGVGGLNIDGCRLAGESTLRVQGNAEIGCHGGNYAPGLLTGHDDGRWPANLLHDGSHVALDALAGAGRFFYCAKASQQDRDAGLEHFAMASPGQITGGRKNGSAGLNSPRAGAGRVSGGRNTHPTVKPTALMCYLVRLVTPPGGVVLDPFMGSGSTGKAAAMEGMQFIGIEQNPDYVEIARARIASGEGLFSV